MNWLPIALVGFVLAIILVIIASSRLLKGRRYSISELSIAIDALLKRGFNGGFLVIKRWSNPEFLQLRKYIKDPSDYGIELCFPRANWSVAYFDSVSRYCDSNNFEYRSEIWNDQDGMEFLVVDFGQDVRGASGFVVEIFREVFSVDEQESFRIRLGNSSI